MPYSPILENDTASLPDPTSNPPVICGNVFNPLPEVDYRVKFGNRKVAVIGDVLNSTDAPAIITKNPDRPGSCRVMIGNTPVALKEYPTTTYITGDFVAVHAHPGPTPIPKTYFQDIVFSKINIGPT